MSRAEAVWSAQCRLLGWEPRVRIAARPGAGSEGETTIVHPDRGRQISGRTLTWLGPGPSRSWELPTPIAASRVDSGERWATLDGIPVAAGEPGSRTAAVGLDPGDLHGEPEIGAVMRRVLLACEPAAAWLDLEGAVALRMDDPGASASVHLDPWSFEKLDPEAWESVGELLAGGDARMTIAYTPGWVDDGDAERGELVVAGEPVARRGGEVHPSPLVRYRGLSAHSGDYEAEYRAIIALRERGLCSVEMHGYTHVHPELERWAAAPSRHRKLGWYRELAPETATAVAGRALEQHPIAKGLELFRQHFGESPSALVCPGNACGEDALRTAFELGFDAVAADRLALRGPAGFAWLEGVPTVAFEAPDRRLLGAGGPAVAGLHDRDLALAGVERLGDGLAEWRAAGARRFLDLRELISALGLRLGLESEAGRMRLRVSRQGAAPLPRPLDVLVRIPDGVPARLMAVTPLGELELGSEALAATLARIELPAGV